MSKIKILHLIKSLGRGGAETLLPETLKLHDKNKFEFHYIYFLPWKNQMVGDIEIEGGTVQCFSSKNNFKMLQQYKKVIDYCRIHKINMLHCHLPWSGFLGRIIFSKINLPVVYTEHNIQERYHILTKKLNKWSFNSQSVVLGVSADVTRSIIENINPDIAVKTLLNGVNTTKFTRNPIKGEKIKSQLGIPEKAIVLGNIAVFREQKGLLDWINAFKLIANSNDHVYGILVGAGPLEREIKLMVSSLKLENRLLLPGLQTDTVSYFSAMDIFMMSSAFEGLPIALLEAMSMNCAVVSTKAGGVVEVITDVVDGRLCNVHDVINLAKITTELIENPVERERLQNAARERVIKEFSLETMVQKLEDVYLNYSQG